MDAIIAAIEKAIENTVIKEWHHSGYLDGTYCDGVRCVIDGEHYLIAVSKEADHGTD